MGSPATPILPEPRVTYGDLWSLAGRGRDNAEIWLRVCEAELAAALAKGDIATADTYRRAGASHAQRLAQYETLQKLVGRIESSETIKAELKRIAERERAATQGGGEDGNHDED